MAYRRPLIFLWKAAILAMALSCFAFPVQAACLSPHEARGLVASGQVMPFAAAAAAAASQGFSGVQRGALCDGGGGFVYRLTAFGPGGGLATLIIDARSGTILAVQ
jgi:hypothetical protein